MSRLTLTTLCLALSLLSGFVGCADQADLDTQSADKSWYSQEGESSWSDDAWGDDAWGSNSSDPWASDTSDSAAAWGDDQLVATQTQEAQEASLGGYCASGCIWSSYAVDMGAQSASASCGGQPCACVVEGDIWSLCEASSSGSSNTSSNNTSSNNTSSTSSVSSHGAYNASVGNRIADEAYYIATRRNTVGYCYNAAADAIEAVVGRFLWGSSAYMAADQLASHSRFTEVSVSDLRTLPAGAVVVWSRGSSEHGHISIALGNGREASDHIAQQMTYHYGGGSARVFYPN